MLFIFDGTRLLVHDAEEYRPWQLYDNAREHPDQYAFIAGVLSTPGSEQFAQNCPSAAVAGHRTILGRHAVGYHCAAQHYSDGSWVSAHVMWLDQATWVMLKEGAIHAWKFDDHPQVTAATFDTEPPAGAKVEHYAPRRTGQIAPDFTLPNVRNTGPRTFGLTDYADGPLVLAFFSSDLTFAPEEAPREIGSLRTIQALTSGGTDPPVLGIQEGEAGKPGHPLIPKGLDIDVANDPGAEVQHAYGLSNLVGYAFVSSDGNLQHVFDEPPSEEEFQTVLHKLR